jgi:hypothetical protein
MDFSRTPHQKAAGNLKNKKRLILKVEVRIFIDLGAKYRN